MPLRALRGPKSGKNPITSKRVSIIHALNQETQLLLKLYSQLQLLFGDTRWYRLYFCFRNQALRERLTEAQQRAAEEAVQAYDHPPELHPDYGTVPTIPPSGSLYSLLTLEQPVSSSDSQPSTSLASVQADFSPVLQRIGELRRLIGLGHDALLRERAATALAGALGSTMETYLDDSDQQTFEEGLAIAFDGAAELERQRAKLEAFPELPEDLAQALDSLCDPYAEATPGSSLGTPTPCESSERLRTISPKEVQRILATRTMNTTQVGAPCRPYPLMPCLISALSLPIIALTPTFCFPSSLGHLSLSRFAVLPHALHTRAVRGLWTCLPNFGSVYFHSYWIPSLLSPASGYPSGPT